MTLQPPIKGERHLIDSVKFQRGNTEGSRIVCFCSWMGTVAQWSDHRGVLGQNRPAGRHKQQNISGDGMGGSERWR